MPEIQIVAGQRAQPAVLELPRAPERHEFCASTREDRLGDGPNGTRVENGQAVEGNGFDFRARPGHPDLARGRNPCSAAKRRGAEERSAIHVWLTCASGPASTIPVPA